MSTPHETPISGAWATASQTAGERYERLGLLGEGGMGSVWRARDRALNRDVAYKTVRPDAPEEARERLIQEARIAANLAGTGCVTVFDHGTAADGRPYYTMELLTFPAFGAESSQSLHQLLDVVKTLGAAHARGIVHRDVKPSNVGLAGTRAVLADWGLARPVEAVSEWDQSILTQARPRTTTGLAMGTAGYMAPEQLTGAPASLRADVWSLGAMLYDLITEDGVVQGGGHTLMGQVVAGTLALPDTDLGRLASAALSLDPQARPADASVFAADLRRCLQPKPPEARAWVTRLAGVAVVAVAGGLVMGWTSVPDFRPQASQATSALAWSHADIGRRQEARALGEQADAEWSTPDSRGLLTLPVSSGAEATAYPADCPLWVLDDQQALAVCVRPDMVTTYASDGSMRWEVAAANAYAVRASGGLVTLADSFSNLRVRPDGTVARMSYASTEALLPVGDDWYLKTGDRLRRVSSDGSVAVDLAADVDQLVGIVGSAAVSAERGHIVFRDGEALASVFLGQLVVAMREVGDAVWLVGERGVVVELERQTWTERRRFSLPGRGEVLAAAIGPGGEVVWSTRHGVFRSLDGVVTDQISTFASHQLVVDDNGRVWGVTDGEVWQWRTRDADRHLYPSLTRSITGLARRGPYLLVGTDDGLLMTVDPGSGEANTASWNGENVRDIFSTPEGIWAVVGGSLMLASRDGMTHERIASAAVLGDGTMVGVGRWGPGVSWLKDGTRHDASNTETFRSIQADASGEFAIARTIHGDLWRIDPDHGLAPLGIHEVSAFTSNEAGLVVARGSIVFIPGAQPLDVGETITSLHGDRDFVVVGTRLGTVWILSHQADELARIQAHGERISALTFWGDDLFTGSWEPGVRRWELAALRL